MHIEVPVPALPESVADATVVAWHKQPGDPIKRDENLVDLETDKVVLEVPAPADGILQDILKPEGDVVTSGELLAVMDNATTATPSSPESNKHIQDPPISPSVRKQMHEHDVPEGVITGTGKDGRITHADVDAWLNQQTKSSDVQRKPPETDSPPPPTSGPSHRTEQRVPLTRLRKRVAERLMDAQHNAALLTTFNEVNLQAVMDLRKRYQESFQEAHGVKIGFMSFFVKSVIEALKSFPVINATLDGEDLVYHNYFDIGIAVGSPRGLVVPIMRDADLMDLATMEKTIKDFGARAQDGSLSVEELTGGTFSITNGGVFGSMLSTPIINPPQSAILGMHAIQQRPVAENGEVVIRPMMYLALTYDHRIIDGREAVQFLVQIKQRLEDPTRFLLQI